LREIIIVAGPNGAGKTSFANQYLPVSENDLAFVNADEIARRYASNGLSGTALDLAAGREMLATIDRLVGDQAEFMFETTLATLVYAHRIPIWKAHGYSIALIYLRLPSIEASIDRVRRRVDAGGHFVPEEAIRRRFVRSLDYLDRIYKAVVDEWYVYSSLEGRFELIEAWDD
jgi:predicted ABC-type ATPase